MSDFKEPNAWEREAERAERCHGAWFQLSEAADELLGLDAAGEAVFDGDKGSELKEQLADLGACAENRATRWWRRAQELRRRVELWKLSYRLKQLGESDD